jgi:hypothetical protein
MTEAATGVSENGSAPHDWAPRKLTHEQARTEQRLYWSRRSYAQRLAAMTALTKRMYRMRGIDLDELSTDLTPRFVRRGQR